MSRSRALLSCCFSLFFLLGFSPAIWALTSLCSETLLPDGRSTLKHETNWSLYDNWFYNLYAQVRTEVEGPAPVSQVNDIPMLAGGHITHLLAEPLDGQYTLRGEVQVGYPAPWGFDGYYTISCPEWEGALANATDEDAEEQSAEIADVSTIPAAAPVTFDDLLASACEGGQDPQACAYLQSLSEAEQQQLVDDWREAQQPMMQAVGFVADVDDQRLTLTTTTGQYYHFILPEDLPGITRHEGARLSAIQEGDHVFVQPSPSDEVAPLVQVVRGEVDRTDLPLMHRPHSRQLVNRAALQSQLAALGSLDLDDEQPLAHTIQVTYEQDGSTLNIPAHSVATIISPANLSDLEPLRRYVRVIAYPSTDEQDPTPTVRAVEILN